MATTNHQPFPIFTFEEYLERNRRSDDKLEYLQGVVYAMAGGSQYHNALPMNLAVALGGRLKGRDCHILSSDQMVETPGREASFFPDLTIVCGAKLEPGHRPVTNPVLVVEVLSPSTREFDLGQKLKQYKRIPSLRHIVYVDSDSVGVQVHSRGDGELWPGLPDTYRKRDDVISLEAIEAEISLRDIYGDLEF